MVDTNKKVIGSYATREEALNVVDRLKDKGFQKQNIILYSNKDTASTMSDHEAVDVVADNTDVTASPGKEDDNKSMWDKIKDAFTDDTYEYDESTRDNNYNQDNDILYPYRDDIRNGNIVVVVDNAQSINLDDFDSTGTVMGAGPDTNVAHDTSYDRDLDKTDDLHTPRVDATDDVDRTAHTDEKIRLKEEQLEVDKNEVTTGEVNVHKKVVKDTETVEVPVEREEVVIERKPVTDQTSTDDITDEDTINIPIKEEQIEVTKKPVVTEEVEVRKETHTDTKKVSEEVQHEELDVDTDGDVRVDDGGTTADRRESHTGLDTSTDTPTDMNAPRDSSDDLLRGDDEPGLTDRDVKRDMNDPLTEGRKYSREDEDLDGFRK